MRSLWISRSKIEIAKISKIVDLNVIICFSTVKKRGTQILSIIIMINSAPFLFNYYQILLHTSSLDFVSKFIGKLPIKREFKWLGF